MNADFDQSDWLPLATYLKFVSNLPVMLKEMIMEVKSDQGFVWFPFDQEDQAEFMPI